MAQKQTKKKKIQEKNFSVNNLSPSFKKHEEVFSSNPSPYILNLREIQKRKEDAQNTFAHKLKKDIAHSKIIFGTLAERFLSWRIKLVGWLAQRRFNKSKRGSVNEISKPAFLKELEDVNFIPHSKDFNLDELILQNSIKENVDVFEKKFSRGNILYPQDNSKNIKVNFASHQALSSTFNNKLEKNTFLKKIFYFPFNLLIKFKKRLFSLGRNKTGEVLETNLDSLNFFERIQRHKVVLNFAVIALFIVFPIVCFSFYNGLLTEKNKVYGAAQNALQNLKTAQAASYDFDLDLAGLKFNEARKNFLIARDELNNLNILLSGLLQILPNKKIKAGQILIEVGEDLSGALQHLSQGISYLTDNDVNGTFTDRIILMRNEFKISAPLIAPVLKKLNQIDSTAIPQENQDDFNKIKQSLPVIQKLIDKFLSESDALLDILGHYQKKRYLIIFQNNTEQRPTGGFMGSYALVDIYKGKITKLEIPGGGFYDLKGSLRSSIVSPAPLHLINTVFEPQDANWYFDFPSSAQKIIWFYYKSGGPTVDGVMALNTFVLKDILEITGPIDMKEYGKQISSGNFIEEIQKAVEFEYDLKLNKPKQIISDLAPKLIQKFFQFKDSQYIELTGLLASNLAQKNLMLYFTDEKLEKLVQDLNWAGEIKETEKDYLAVVDTNIAGGKTDGVIKESIQHSAEILDDGSVIDTVTVTRTHLGDKANIFTGVNNVDYIRVYVPLGSTLLEASGFNPPPQNYFENPSADLSQDEFLEKMENESMIDPNSGTVITVENNKTVFGNWVQVDVGESSVAVFKYRLPFKINFIAKRLSDFDLITKIKKLINAEDEEMVGYSLLVQKQSGSWQTEFSSELITPQDWVNVWKYPNNLQNNQIKWIYNNVLDKDNFLGLVFKKAKY